MDRFKFRAWHSIQKRMIDIYGLGPDFVTENTLDGVDPGTNAFMGDDFEKLIIMQCTGIMDKKGTYIYEGDILGFGKSITTYAVVWNKDGWLSFSKEGDKYGPFSRGIYPNTRYDKENNMSFIVGNIYENPELLKEVENGGT